jgi:MYXO-CTERM domain-containing protein
MRALALALAAGAAGGAAEAQVYTEMGDALELAGGQATGSGVLTAIEGVLGGNEADMYAIRVDDWSLFSASTVDDSGLVSPFFDTSLFLFDSNGFGIAFHDDSVEARAAFDAGNPVFAGRANGEIVWLAISGYDYDPTSGGAEIWIDDPWDVTRAPDGPGAAGAVDGWSGFYSGSGAYRVTLSGVSSVPGPGVLALFGLGAVVALRRR